MFLRLNVTLLLLLFLSGSPAFANFVGNDTQNFNPIQSGLDFITVNGSDALDRGLLNTGFFVNHAKNSLPDTIDGSGNRVNSDDSIQFADFSFAYGVYNRLELGLSLSFLLNQETNRKVSGAQFGSTGLNEVRFGSKYSILERKPIGIAVAASFNFNQSDNNPFSGKNSGPTTNLEAIADSYIGPVLVAANLGYRWRQPGDQYAGAVYEPLPDQAIGSLAASYYLPKADLKIIGEIFAAKPDKSVAFVDSGKISSEFLLGGKYDVNSAAAVQIGAGSRLGDGLFTPDWRVYAGLNVALDIGRKPAKVTSDQPEVVQFNTVKGYQPKDIEALWNTPFDEIAKLHEFHLRKTIPDADFVGQKPPFEIIRLDGFDFDFGSAVIKPEYNDMLNKLAAYLATEPKVLKIRIEGHTDSLGSLDRNRRLGQLRADAVKDYLFNSEMLKNLIMEPVGYGADRPISDNSNFQGRKANRRVEIRILRRIPAPPESTQRIKGS